MDRWQSLTVLASCVLPLFAAAGALVPTSGRLPPPSQWATREDAIHHA